MHRLLAKLILPRLLLAALLAAFAAQAQALFIQPDTLDPSQPGVGTNRYAYSMGDPINLYDPRGTNAENPTFGERVVSWIGSAIEKTVSDLGDRFKNGGDFGNRLSSAGEATFPSYNGMVSSIQAGNYQGALIGGVGAVAEVALPGIAGRLTPVTRGSVTASGIAAIDDAAETVVFRNLAPSDEIVPQVLFPTSQIQQVGYTGRLDYVVLESGELVAGRSGHVSLAQGANVLAAGEVRFRGGQVRQINNLSGHYRPSGASAQIAAESAFSRAGFDAVGRYLERAF